MDTLRDKTQLGELWAVGQAALEVLVVRKTRCSVDLELLPKMCRAQAGNTRSPTNTKVAEPIIDFIPPPPHNYLSGLVSVYCDGRESQESLSTAQYK